MMAQNHKASPAIVDAISIHKTLCRSTRKARVPSQKFYGSMLVRSSVLRWFISTLHVSRPSQTPKIPLAWCSNPASSSVVFYS